MIYNTNHAARSTNHESRITPPTVELHIEELVLEGFPEMNQAEIGVAVQAELARLLVEAGLSGFGQGGQINRLDGGAFQVAQEVNATAIGVQVAQALHKGLQQ